MNCPRCQTENEQNAQFCRNCGTNLHSIPSINQSGNKTLDVLVFISIAYWFVVNLANSIIQKLVVNWYDSPAKYFQIFTNILFAAIPILIAVSIRNKGLKIVAIVLAALLSISILYSNIDWLIREIK